LILHVSRNVEKACGKIRERFRCDTITFYLPRQWVYDTFPTAAAIRAKKVTAKQVAEVNLALNAVVQLAVGRVGMSPEGLPIGVQVVAHPWRADVALAMA
jgi:hypothetical protein